MGVFFPQAKVSFNHSNYYEFMLKLAKEAGLTVNRNKRGIISIPSDFYDDITILLKLKLDREEYISPRDSYKLAKRSHELTSHWRNDAFKEKATRLACVLEETARHNEDFMIC